MQDANESNKKKQNNNSFVNCIQVQCIYPASDVLIAMITINKAASS